MKFSYEFSTIRRCTFSSSGDRPLHASEKILPRSCQYLEGRPGESGGARGGGAWGATGPGAVCTALQRRTAEGDNFERMISQVWADSGAEVLDQEHRLQPGQFWDWLLDGRKEAKVEVSGARITQIQQAWSSHTRTMAGAKIILTEPIWLFGVLNC